MMRHVRYLAVLWLVVWTTGFDLSACRFNVRDVGFVDLGSQPYQLFCYIDNHTAEADATLLRDVSLAVYLDCNIKAEVISVTNLSEHPAKAHRGLIKGKTLPAAVLVDARGRTLPIELGAGSGFQDKIWDNLEAVYDSPARAELLKHVVESYGALLLVEGKDARRNQQAKSTAEAAIEIVAKAIQSKSLEKDIKNSPRLVILKPQDQIRERVLLWSLGIDDAAMGETHLAVLYGRARQIGKVLSGDKITPAAVSGILNTIGLSCECGLDRSWMQGHMIPSKWEESTRTLAAKTLGFDPESPVIKMEMSQILSKGGEGRRPKSFGKGDALLAGYSESAAGVAAPQQEPLESTNVVAQPLEPTVVSGRVPQSNATKAVESGAAASESKPARDRGALFMLVVGGFGTLVLLIGVFVFLKSSGNH